MDTKTKKVREKSRNTRGIPFLPDEIIIRILSRLPTKNVIRCQLVCKTWENLTSARFFVDLYLRNSVLSLPTIVYSRGTNHSGLELSAVDNWWESDETKFIRLAFPSYDGKFSRTSCAQASYNGLIVLHEYVSAPSPKIQFDDDCQGAKFIILNPARPSNECVTINLPKELRHSQLHGVYFHALLNEYCALLEIDDSVNPWLLQNRTKTEYKVLNLGSNPSLKTIRNPCNGRLKLGYAKPLLVNNSLYWMIDNEQGNNVGGRTNVMKFDTITEEFTIISCPVPEDTKCSPRNTHLLNIDGVLSYILLLSSKITIWRLEDNNTEQLWTSIEYTIRTNEFQSHWVAVGGIAVVDGKLAHVSGGKLFVYDIIQQTVKTIPKNFLEATGNTFIRKKYTGQPMFLSHKMSLASLKNCSSTIFINKDGEVAQDKQVLDF